MRDGTFTKISTIMSLASINIKFQVDLSQFSTEMQNSLRAIDKFGQKMQQLGQSMSTYVTLPILAAGGAAIKFASDFEESSNKVDVAFGNNADSVKEFSKTTLESFGISKGSALELASLFGDMATSMGLPQAEAAKMSTTLVGLAGDLSSFKNISIEQAQTALKGIYTGETESLKQLGVVMTQAALQEYAYAQGINKKITAMGEAEKVNLRYNFVLAKTANAQGDFERTGGGAANQMRIFQETLKEIATSLGEVILPAFTKIISKVNEWLKAFNNLSDGTRNVIVIVAAVAAAIGPLAIAIGAVASTIPAIIAGFTAMSAAIGLSLGPITLLVAGLAAVAYAVVVNWEPIKKTLVDIANYFVDLYNNSMVFRGAIEGIALSFKNMWAIAKLQFSSLLATGIFVAKSIFDAFKNLGSLIKSVLTFDVAGIKSAFANGFADAGKNAVAFFNSLATNGKETAAEIGANIATALNNTFNGSKLQKLVVPGEKVDATAVSAAVADAVKDGLAGKGEKGSNKVTAIGGKIAPAGLVDVKSTAEIKPIDLNIIDPSWDAALVKMQQIMEMGQIVSSSVGSAFESMSTRLLDSLGLANEGLAGFANSLVQTGFKLISNLLQQVIKTIALRRAESVANAVSGATASGAASGPLAVFTTPAFIATAVGGVLAAFAALPKFESGGIVGGSSFYGDKIMARVNSAEMISNQDQQRNIWGAMNSGSGGVVTIIPSIVYRGADMLIQFERATKEKNRLT